MNLNSGVQIDTETKAWAIVSVFGHITPDVMGRMVYKTKRKAKEVAEQWGVPSNVVEVKITTCHSELDQDNELLNSVKEDWDKQAKNAMNGLDQDVSK